MYSISGFVRSKKFKTIKPEVNDLRRTYLLTLTARVENPKREV